MASKRVRLAAAAVTVAWSSVSLASPARVGADVADVAQLAAQHPAELAAIEEGERLLARGGEADAAAAEPLLRAAAASTVSPLAARAWCAALRRLRRRDEAVAACREAVTRGGSPMDFRATVGALMDGPTTPTPDELAQALLLTRAARTMAPDRPWGYAAEFDVALRLGDDRMESHALDQLTRVAPDDDETRDAEARYRARHPAWPRRLGWAALGLALVGTAAHASRRRRAPIVAALAFALVWTAAPRTARASEAGKGPAVTGQISEWPIDDAHPEASIPPVSARAADPLQFGYWLMDLAAKADAAAARHDPAAAARYYAALARAVPDRSIAFAKACDAYEAMGDVGKALEACRAALGRSGVRVTDYVHYAHIALAGATPLSRETIDDVDAVVVHLREADPTSPAADAVACELGARLEDVGRLEACAAHLEARSKDDPETISYAWALASARRDYGAQVRTLARARSAGLPGPALARMETATAAAEPSWRRMLRDRRFVAAITLLAAALTMVVLRRPREAQRAS